MKMPFGKQVDYELPRAEMGTALLFALFRTGGRERMIVGRVR